MKAIEFQEVNLRIAENQKEYQTLPVNVADVPGTNFRQVTMCFELDEDEKKQVVETGQIWFVVFQPNTDYFHPIRMDAEKPDDLKK